MMENPYSSPAPTGPLDLPEKMEISFVQTADDLAAFNLHYYSTSGAIRARRWLLPGFLLGVCAWMLATSYSRGTPLLDMAPFIGMMGFLGIVGVLMTRRRIRRLSPQLGLMGCYRRDCPHFRSPVHLSRNGKRVCNSAQRFWK